MFFCENFMSMEMFTFSNALLREHWNNGKIALDKETLDGYIVLFTDLKPDLGHYSGWDSNSLQQNLDKNYGNTPS